ncbi:DUF2939 domain-containing protein [Ramlibacter rhizophilus]|nr:DUF2939 domain-containing protein [Ramlibacter rhizophilus]
MSRPSIRRGTRAAALALAGLALLLAAYWWASPYLAVRELGAAARAGDGERFSAHVDYPRVRESLKAQMAARLQRSATDVPGEHPLAGMGRIVGLAMIDPVVETLVRPEVVMLALRQELVVSGDGAAPRAPTAPATSPADAARGRTSAWHYEREGPNRLVVVPRPAPDGASSPKRPVTLVFERRGFARWDLVELRLPPAG